ncbi:hypothetical protein C0585_08110 [Candidatus Woesearchaeota archaeon]|nr:MAG: hypothetical protein C0585_08110 [Candidatus Woesearchaeota archaeon]
MEFGDIRNNLRYLQTKGYKTPSARRSAFNLVIRGDMDDAFLYDSFNSLDELAHLDFTNLDEELKIKPRNIGSAERTIGKILYSKGTVSHNLRKEDSYL